MEIKRKYIKASREFNTIEKHVNAPIFKSVFDACKRDNAILQISVIGFYKLFLNGKEITNGLLAPYINNPNDVVYYDEYDISELLKEKDNVLCVLLGNGFSNVNDNGIWDFNKASFRSAPKMYLNIKVDGKEILNTNSGFMVEDSPITFDDIRCGERFDARLIDDTFYAPIFSKRFRNVIEAEFPLGEYKKTYSDKVIVDEYLKPVKIIKNRDGYIYDFGKVCAGIYDLKINAKNGQEIDMYFSDMINKDEIDISAMVFNNPPNYISPKDYVQHDKYICKEGYQEYSPSFTYHGFRYCFVRGITKKQANKKLLFAKTIHNDIRHRGKFYCSNKIINRIQSCALNSALSNIVHIVTDCPQREKNGWTSEAQVCSEYFLYNYDIIRTMREWLFNIRKAQREDGAIPAIIPTSGWGFEWGNGPQWDKIIVEFPRLMYIFTGDKEIIKENIDCIKKYVGYMGTKINSDGLLDYGLCDWCVAGELGSDVNSTPTEITDSLICIEILRIAQNLFEKADIDFCDDTIDNMELNIVSAFKKKYINDYKVKYESQTAQALAISLNIFDEQYRQKAVEYLVELVHKCDNHLHSGVMGYKYVFNVLAENGYADLAYEMITAKTHPSYANIIQQGATGLWEKFTEYYESEDGIKQKDGHYTNYSLNHCAFGGVSTWFYNYIAGLKIINNKTIIVTPKFLGKIKKVIASFDNEDYSVIIKIKGYIVKIYNKNFNCSFVYNDKIFICEQGENIFRLKRYKES